MHEEQLGLIQSYANIDSLKVCLNYLRKGVSKCEKNFMALNAHEEIDRDISNSESEEEEEKKVVETQKPKFDFRAMLQQNLGKPEDFKASV
jgi:hypothetical protein